MNTPLLDDIKTTNPELYELVYPKAYQYIPNNYISPKQFAENILCFISNLMAKDTFKTDIQVGDNEASLSAIAQFLRRAKPYQLPAFFVDKNFYKSIFNTDIKEEMDYKNLNLPFPSQLIYLPTDIEEEFVLKEEARDCPIEVAGISKYVTNKGQTQYIYFHMAKEYMRFVAKDAEKLNSYLQGFSVSKPFHLVIKTLLARVSRPNLFSSGSKITTNKKKSKRELWTPNFIGKGYKIKEENTQLKLFKGQHSSPRLHWRRGHFRNQRFGEELKEQKIIWIEPTLVGVHEDGERKTNN